jgi:hypothetical protein
MPRRALRNAETWSRLHAYPEPHRAAICALAAAGVDVESIRHMPLNAYRPGGTRVTVPRSADVELEPDSAIFLSAQLHLRTLQGAEGGDWLFPARGHKPLSASAVVQVINDARRELGVAVAPARIDRKPVAGDRWFTRWGISIQELL